MSLSSGEAMTHLDALWGKIAGGDRVMVWVMFCWETLPIIHVLSTIYLNITDEQAYSFVWW